MAESATWIDLLDPDRAELEDACSGRLHARALDQLLAPSDPAREPRPTIESHGPYVYGVFLVPVVDGDRDRVFYQEVDVVMTPDLIVSVRKTPPGDPPLDITSARSVYERQGLRQPGMLVFHLVDDIAERYLDLIDAFNGEIDELEDHVENWPPARVRARLTGLRHDLLHIRQTLGPDPRRRSQRGGRPHPRGRAAACSTATPPSASEARMTSCCAHPKGWSCHAT